MNLLLFLIFAIVITLIVLQLRYRLQYDKVNGRAVIWYNVSRYSTERDYIFLDEILTKF